MIVLGGQDGQSWMLSEVQNKGICLDSIGEPQFVRCVDRWRLPRSVSGSLILETVFVHDPSLCSWLEGLCELIRRSIRESEMRTMWNTDDTVRTTDT